MGERSRPRVRDLVTRPAFEGLSEIETGRARISMMARSKYAPPMGPDTVAITMYNHCLALPH